MAQDCVQIVWNIPNERDLTPSWDNLFSAQSLHTSSYSGRTSRHQFLPLVLLLSTTEHSLIPSSNTSLQILTNIDEVPSQLSLLEDFHPLGLLPFEEVHTETFYAFLKK